VSLERGCNTDPSLQRELGRACVNLKAASDDLAAAWRWVRKRGVQVSINMALRAIQHTARRVEK
jgi:hypothetical protein